MTEAQSVECRPFRLQLEGEGARVIRGCVDFPAGSEDGADPRPYVLVLHGFKGFMDWGFFPLLGRRLAAGGLVAVRFNMSGSGIGEDLESFTETEAFARNTYTRELEDTDVVRAFVEESRMPWVDLDRRGVFGHSMGGGVALLHAAERGDYGACVTWAAISRVQRYDDDTVAAWRREGVLVIRNARTGQELPLSTDILDDVLENGSQLDVRAACRRSATPTLLVHGSEDEAVPFAEGETLEAARAESPAADRGRFVAVHGAGHTFGAVHPPRETTPHLERVLAETVGHFRRHLLEEA